MSTLYIDTKASIAYLRATKNASSTILSSFYKQKPVKVYPPFEAETINNLNVFSIIREPLERYVASLTQIYIEQGHTKYNLLDYYGLEYVESITYLISLINNLKLFPIYDRFNLGKSLNNYYKDNNSSWCIEKPLIKQNKASEKILLLRQEIYKHIVETPLNCHHLFYSLSPDYFLYYKTLNDYRLSNSYYTILKYLKSDTDTLNNTIYNKIQNKDFKNIFILYSALYLKNQKILLDTKDIYNLL